MTGDTPALLYMIPNGLSDPEHPEWGSWGGRYGPVVWGEGHFADSIDIMEDNVSGKVIMSSHATIWRWRQAFQSEFAARMQWTLGSEYSSASHSPVPILNGSITDEILQIDVDAGETIILDASESCNPDGGGLVFRWWQYLEPSSNNNKPESDATYLDFEGDESAKVIIRVPKEEVMRRRGRGAHPDADKHMHVILEVSNGELVAYRRVILTSQQIKGDVHGGRSRDEL